MYLLFQGEGFYPRGGAWDCAGFYPTIKGAIRAAEVDDTYRWAHVAKLEGERLIVVAKWRRCNLRSKSGQ